MSVHHLLSMLGALLCLAAAEARAADRPATAPGTVAAAEKEGKLVVYSTTDSASAGPLLKDFAALYPKIALEYDDLNSTEVYNRFVSEAGAGAGSADGYGNLVRGIANTAGVGVVGGALAVACYAAVGLAHRGRPGP